MVNIFVNAHSAILRSSINGINFIIGEINSWQIGWYFLVGFISISGLIIGSRLRRYNHPDHPLISPVVRHLFGQGVFWCCALLTTAATLVFLSLLALTFISANATASINGLNLYATFQNHLEIIWVAIRARTLALFLSSLCGLAVGLIVGFRTIPLLERGRGLRDVRYMQKLFAKMHTFSPLSYVNLKQGIFVGLEEGKHPVYVPIHQFRETHTQIMGASGSGKGIALGLLGFQFVKAGECVIAFDPKGDQRLPLVLAEAAKQAGVPFHSLDLNPTAQPQFNLLAGMQAHDIEEMFVGGLGLQPTSGDSDYYRGIDQDAAETVAGYAQSIEKCSMLTLLEFAQGDENISKADNFVRRLKQVCQLPVIQTTHDIDLTGVIKRGGVLYVRGSTDNHRVKMLQTMLLIRILQIIKANGGARKVALILDEFKHLLCAVSLDALGTVRELGAHALLAHQSMGDLGMCPGLRREDVEPRVVDNTTLKLIYRINDAKTSANFAALSGKQRTHIEGIRGLDDERKDQRTWTESQEFLMSEDIFTRLHRPSDGKDVVAAGVLFGHKSAKLIAVSPIQVKGMPPSIAPAPIDSIVTLATPEVLI
jgi:TraM recognition site of TraD and TraG